MADKIHKTKGIVLRTVKYGETSIIVSVFTELFGLQSYIVNGVRGSNKKGVNKAALFQTAAVLEMEVYHNSFKQINRIKECRFAEANSHIFSQVIKNGVAQYMIELLTKCLKEPENNPDLFAFVEDGLRHLNTCTDAEMANFPVFFALHLSGFFGFFPRNQTSGDKQMVFDMQEGVFTDELPSHSFYLSPAVTAVFSELARAWHPSELGNIRTNADVRRKILEALETYYALHIQDFGKLKTIAVLRELMR